MRALPISTPGTTEEAHGAPQTLAATSSCKALQHELLLLVRAQLPELLPSKLLEVPLKGHLLLGLQKLHPCSNFESSSIRDHIGINSSGTRMLQCDRQLLHSGTCSLRNLFVKFEI